MQETQAIETHAVDTPAKPRELPQADRESLYARLRRRVKPTDLLIIIGFIVIVALLVTFLINRLQLKRDVAAATIVTNQVIDDLAKRDGAAARALGNDKFKSTYTAAKLTEQFKTIELVTSEKPAIDQRAVQHGKAGKTVAVVYKYPKKLADQSFYVVVAVSKHNGSSKWQLTNISGSADPSKISL